jgi:hypothetical protein
MALTKLSTDVIDLSGNTEALTIPKGVTSDVPLTVDYLVVAGGGGGGSFNNAGGGGAGGLKTNFGSTKIVLSTVTNYTTTVGPGGAGQSSSAAGGDGTNSLLSGSDITNIESEGGGGGATGSAGGGSINPAGNGGSGGGSGWDQTNQGTGNAGEGFNGGTGTQSGKYTGGGGGGASEAGSTNGQGLGGDGLEIQITGATGATATYAGGGGGGADNTGSAGGTGGGGAGAIGAGTAAVDGSTNTGGGGGGGHPSSLPSGAGGSGIVILRYPNIFTATYTAGTGGTADSEVTVGTDKYIKITAGTGTVAFSGTPITGRPSSPTEGLMRENTTTSKMEFYDGSLWQEITDTANTYVSGLIPSANFNTALYTGNGGADSVAVGFQSELTWIKGRNTTGKWNVWYDIVRGVTSMISSNSTGVAQAYGSVTPTATGFDIGSASAGDLNTNAEDYVSWNWKAGGAATTIASGTNGSTVASDVSANQAAGFSIVQYTTAGSKIISHGLSQAPELIIQKRTDVTSEWVTYTATTGLQKYLQLQSDAAVVSDANFMIAVGASTFTSQWSSNSHDYINYCFHSILGYSKIGFYVGTGATQNIYLGFKPAWVMFKSIDSGASFSSWVIFDNKRNTSNPRTCEIYANLDSKEYCTTGSAPNYRGLNFTDTGIELLSTSYSNEAFETFIYMAFSE